MRVGDPKLDNTHLLRDNDSFAMLGRRGGRSASAPLDDDPEALRASLWLATDERYKEAVERLVKIKSERAIDTQDDDNSDDFSAEKPGTFIGPVRASFNNLIVTTDKGVAQPELYKKLLRRRKLQVRATR